MWKATATRNECGAHANEDPRLGRIGRQRAANSREISGKKTSEDSGLYTYLPLTDIALIPLFPASPPSPPRSCFSLVAGVRPSCSTLLGSGFECAYRAGLLICYAIFVVGLGVPSARVHMCRLLGDRLP